MKKLKNRSTFDTVSRFSVISDAFRRILKMISTSIFLRLCSLAPRILIYWDRLIFILLKEITPAIRRVTSL